MPGRPQTDPAVPRARVANIANVLTGVRLVLVPVFLLVLFAGDGQKPAGASRLRHLRRRGDHRPVRRGARPQLRHGDRFGTLADPIADKALIGAALIGLSMLGDLPWWVTVVIMVRELGITVLRFAVLRRGVIPASRGGKLKTLVQTVAIGLFVLPMAGAWRPVRGW